MSVFRDQLLKFIGELRSAGVRISVAESIDAMNAVAVAGLERMRLRESLAAALIKDEADRPAFDAAFAKFFASPEGRRGRHPDQRGVSESAAAGMGRPGDNPQQQETPSRETRPGELSRSGTRQEPSSREEPKQAERSSLSFSAQDTRSARETEAARSEQRQGPHTEREAGLEAGRIARHREIERRPFEQYTDLDYERAREALAPLKRRFRIRLGRRLGRASRGRVDFRRTIRAAIQHGGALAELRFRARRPRRVDVVILADISGSVRYAAQLMLELLAGARECFSRVRTFVYIDRLAEAELLDGHVTMSPPLDYLARSDFGNVLAQLWEQRAQMLNRQTVVVIMGDARNNRRPARAELLREIARVSRGVVWLNPEEVARWGTGDSAMRQYERDVTLLVPARNLHELERGLAHAVG